MTSDPKLRTANTANGQVSVCSFAIAVNSRRGGQKETTYFECTAWRQAAETIAKYTRKGSKLCVTGEVSLRQYTKSDGSTGASLQVSVDSFEFCDSLRGQQDAPAAQPEPMPVDMGDELPF